MVDEYVICVVERKTIGDFATSLVSGSLTFAIAELAALPTAAVAVAVAVAVEGTHSSLSCRSAPTRTSPD